MTMQTFILWTKWPVHMMLLAVYKHPVDLVLQKSFLGILSRTEMLRCSFWGCAVDLDCICSDLVCQINVPERNVFTWNRALKAGMFFYVSFSMCVEKTSFCYLGNGFCFACIPRIKLNLSGRCLVFLSCKIIFLLHMMLFLHAALALNVLVCG